mmetsp:Transcript_2790/g.9330  ORF Transcript_2790/g.9330 Transcript_2790/m.9330 type:complete len:217 (-) Transcript_2790:96-746(-)
MREEGLREKISLSAARGAGAEDLLKFRAECGVDGGVGELGEGGVLLVDDALGGLALLLLGGDVALDGLALLLLGGEGGIEFGELHRKPQSFSYENKDASLVYLVLHSSRDAMMSLGHALHAFRDIHALGDDAGERSITNLALDFDVREGASINIARRRHHRVLVTSSREPVHRVLFDARREVTDNDVLAFRLVLPARGVDFDVFEHPTTHPVPVVG